MSAITHVRRWRLRRLGLEASAGSAGSFVAAVRRGFSLVELMVVVAIIAILLVIILPFINRGTDVESAIDVVGSLLTAGRAQAMAYSTYVAVDFDPAGNVSYRRYVAPPVYEGNTRVTPDPVANGRVDQTRASRAVWEPIPGMVTQRVPGGVVVIHGNAPTYRYDGVDVPRDSFAVVFGPGGALERMIIRRPGGNGSDALYGFEPQVPGPNISTAPLSPSRLKVVVRQEMETSGDVKKYLEENAITVQIGGYSGSIIRQVIHDPQVSPLPE